MSEASSNIDQIKSWYPDEDTWFAYPSKDSKVPALMQRDSFIGRCGHHIESVANIGEIHPQLERYRLMGEKVLGMSDAVVAHAKQLGRLALDNQGGSRSGGEA